MLPKRIMHSGSSPSSSLSKLVVECETIAINGKKTESTKLIMTNRSNDNTEGYGSTSTLINVLKDTEQFIHRGQSSIKNVLWNMLNLIIGTGILGIPSIYKSTGVIGSIFLMLIFGAISVYTLNLIIMSGKKVNAHNYESLVQKCFGMKGYILSSSCIVILNLGGMLTNLIIISDALIDIIQIWGFQTQFDARIVLLFLSFGLILPLCLFRDLSKLEKASLIKMLAIIVIIIVIFLEFFNSMDMEQESTKKEITLFIELQSIPSAVGIIAFSFVCHDSTFLLYNTLKNPTSKRFFKLSFLGVFIAILFTLCLSLPAYLTFGNEVHSNILTNYNIYNPLIISIRLIYIFSMALTYPGSFFLVRHILYAWFQKSMQNEYTVQTAPLLHHLVFSLAIFCATVTTALFVTDLGVVMSIVGSISSVNLAFVFPTLCYMKIILKSKESVNYFNLVIPAIIASFGVGIAVYSTFTSLSF